MSRSASSSGNPAALTIYAAKRVPGSAVTILVVNRTAGNLTSTVSLAHMTVHSVAAYEYTPAKPASIVAGPALVPSNALTVTFPAESLTLLVAS